MSCLHVCRWATSMPGGCLNPEEGVRSLKTGVIDGNELPCGCWELNPRLLQEPQVLLTSSASLQPCLQLSVRLLTTWRLMAPRKYKPESSKKQNPNFFKFLNNYFIFIFCALLVCLHACLCEVFGSPGTGVTDDCELPCRCWELNLVLWKNSQCS